MKISIMHAVLLLCFTSLSCGQKDERLGRDYKFSKVNEGWHFIIYEQKKEQELPQKDDRLVIDFSQTNVVKTSSKYDSGWAKDRYFLKGEKIKSSRLGGLFPSHYHEGVTSKKGIAYSFEAMFVGNSANVSKYGDPQKIIEEMFDKE